MSYPERAAAQSITSDQLWEIRTLVGDGHYADALAIIRSAKALSPRNIYLIGLEKQVEKLLNLARTSSLPASERNAILESLSTLIGRAVEGMSDSGSSGRAPAEESNVKAKETALETLKSGYFQHADEYLKKGDYKAALVEIRRVFIIEPENEIARDYEKNLQQLVQLQEHGNRPAAEDKEVFGDSVATDSASAPPSSKRQADHPHAKQSGKEGRAPAPVERPLARTEPEPEKKSHAGVIGGVVVGIVVLIAAGVFLLSPKKPAQSTLPEPELAKQVVPPGEQPSGSGSTKGSEERSSKDSKRSGESGRSSSSSTIAEVTTTEVKETKEAKDTKESKETKATKDAKETKEAKAVKEPVKTEPAPPIAKTEEKPAATTDNAASPNAPAESERMPEVVKLEQPSIPITAWGSANSAEVVARVRINTKGEPIQIKIVQSTNASLNKSVIEAIKKSQFLPGYMPTGPVTTWLTIPFKFKKPGT